MKELNFQFFCERELERWQGVMQEIMAPTDEIQKAGGSTKQEQYDGKISWRFEDEKDLEDDLE